MTTLPRAHAEDTLQYLAQQFTQWRATGRFIGPSLPLATALLIAGASYVSKGGIERSSRRARNSSSRAETAQPSLGHCQIVEELVKRPPGVT